MRSYRLSYAVVTVLFCGHLLSACSQSDRPSWMNTITGKPNRPYDNIAIGTKHPPMLNPKPGTLKRPTPPGAPPSLESNPYDYFDAVGNPVGTTPPPAMPAPMEDTAGSQDQRSAVTPRKSFPVNLPYSDALPPASGAPAAQAPPQAPVAAVPAETAKPKAATATDYPELSSVPYAPSQLREIKAQREKETLALEQEHVKASQQKQALEQGIVLETPPAMPWQAPTSSPAEPPVVLGHAYQEAPASGYAARMRSLQQTAVTTPAEY